MDFVCLYCSCLLEINFSSFFFWHHRDCTLATSLWSTCRHNCSHWLELSFRPNCYLSSAPENILISRSNSNVGYKITQLHTKLNNTYLARNLVLFFRDRVHFLKSNLIAIKILLFSYYYSVTIYEYMIFAVLTRYHCRFLHSLQTWLLQCVYHNL